MKLGTLEPGEFRDLTREEISMLLSGKDNVKKGKNRIAVQRRGDGNRN